MASSGIAFQEISNVTFDHRATTFVSADVLAMMVCVYNGLAARGTTVEILWNPAQATYGYAERIGFFETLSEAVAVERPAFGFSTYDAYRNNNSELLELTALDLRRPETGDDCLSHLNKRLEANLADVPDAETVVGRIATVASETVGNVFEHSETPVPGVVVAQRYRTGQGGKLQLVIADAGLGLTRTLREGNRRAATMSDDELINAAFHEGISSKAGPGRGGGLAQCARLAVQLCGNLRVRTNGTWSKLMTKTRRKGLALACYEPNAAFLPGTWLTFDFYLDRLKA